LRATLNRRERTSPTSWKVASAVLRLGGLAQLVDLALDGLVGHDVEVEAGRRRAALDLARVQRSGQVLGDLAEDARLAAGLGGLDGVPVGEHLAGTRDFDLAEDVRVAADELLAAVLGDPGQVARAALLEQQRQEVDLEEDVAELVEKLRVVAAQRRVGQLVGLFDGVRDDRALVLLTIPRALAAQAPREVVQGREGVGDLGTRHGAGP
jgi:hypothetical protein